MGGTQPKSIIPSSNSFLQVLLEKNIFFPGEPIKGCLQIKSSKPINYGQILYQIKQTEYWNVKKYEHINFTKSSSDIIVNSMFNYQNLIGIPLAEGISLPFSILLPQYMIPSLEYSLVDRQAYIRTELIVRIQELNLYAITFIVIQKPAAILNSPLILSSKRTTKILGLINLGNVEIEGSYPTNNFSFFGNIPLQVKINASTSRLKLKSVLVKLLRRIKFLDHVKEDKYLIWDEELYHTTSNITTNNCSFDYNIVILEPEKIFNRYCLGSSGLNITDKRQLINFLPSVTSSMISCEYFIKIEAEYNSSFHLSKNPVLEMPLSITHQSADQTSQSICQMYQQVNQGLNQVNGVVNNNYPEAPNMAEPVPVGQEQYPYPSEPENNNIDYNNGSLSSISQSSVNNYPIKPDTGNYPSF